MKKDLFSLQSKKYAKYRISYPKEIYKEIYKILKKNKIPFEFAWDCGTGNGQVAKELAKKFSIVYATDISENQIKEAIKKPNIFYSIEPAENTSLKDNSINLITVAQALHWFEFEPFYEEIKRVSKKPAILAIWCYSTCIIRDSKINRLFNQFYKNILGPYWEKERKYVEEGYQNIDIPFRKILEKNIEFIKNFTKSKFVGYLSTWSSVQKYIEIHNQNPIYFFKKEIEPYWNSKEKKEILFPIHLKIFLIE